MTDPLFASRPSGVVRVALPVPIDSLFDYTLPATLEGEAAPGCRVLVPFSGRKLTGVVVERLDDTGSPTDSTTHTKSRDEHTRPGPDIASLASIEQLLDPLPVISEPMLALLARAAEDVLCPIGIALASALPAGSAPRVARDFELLPRGRQALEAGAVRGPARDVLAALLEGPRSATQLGRRIPRAGALLEALATDGLVHRGSQLRGPRVRVATERVLRPQPDLDLERACAETLSRAPKQAALLRRLVELGEVTSEDLAARTGASPELARTLVKRGLAWVEERDAPRNVLGPPVDRDDELPLTPEQQSALEPIVEAVQERRGAPFLLHGVTGSGKTEVYLRAIAVALAEGRQALVLVPEITLTHQIVARLRARFGDSLAVLHSGLKPGERLEQWMRLRAGDTPIAVGARSALFAPLEDVGVIVIDEEHDSAYKNEEGFRYHARRLAEGRAKLAGCPLILGSATPALETRRRAETGEIERLVLERRIGGRPLPSVEIVDLEAERRKAPRGRRLVLSKPLRRALKKNLEDGGQSILFLNRRGFSTQIFCFECGFAERCPACDVALVYHAAEHALRCHYCDYLKPPPERCGGCGNVDTALLGTGTERLEEEVRSLLPEARLARMDRDTAQRRGHVESVLGGLRDNQIDILIGTQMVAKGHDFPGVRLVGVIAADLGLHMPDFRAAERTFQLLTQVAGRAGRAGTPGRVILQTFVPEHYAIQPVLRHDYEHFYRQEIEHRASLGYPPFGRLTQVIVSSEDEEEARKAGEALATAARAKIGDDRSCEVLGPAPAPFPRLRGRHRIQLVVKGRDEVTVRDVSRHILEAARRLGKSLAVAVDVDPVNML